MSGWNSLAAVYEEGGKLCFYSRGHDGLNDLGDGHEGSVVGWSEGIAGYEKWSTRSTPNF